MFFVYIICLIIWGAIWGFATNTVISNKGYDENWFWWGFFFGIIALLVALGKPNCYETQQSYAVSKMYEDEDRKNTLDAGGWECYCGNLNPYYTGTCSCGRTKSEVLNFRKQEKEQKESTKKMEAESAKLDNLKKLKDLLDSGVLTQEEFDKKKKQLLEM